MRDLLPVFEAACKGVAFVGGYLADALSERLKAFARYEDGDYLDASAASPMAAAETVDSVAGTPVDEGSPEVALSPRPSGEHPTIAGFPIGKPEVDHIARARRFMARAANDGDMGRIERAMHITEANNHLLWHLIAVSEPRK